jgi:pyruvate dehydrogenase E1 component alpha subunit
MVLSRELDLFLNERVEAGDSVPHFHSGIGQEALSVAAVAALDERDYLLYTHRGYAQLLARGVPLATLLTDMLCRVGGTNGGFGGVMHVHDPDLGIVGRNGVFGTRFTIGMGLALASLLQGDGRVTLCLTGEAEGARGPLYEALNFAVLWQLPLVLVAENNGFSVSTRTEDMFPGGRIMGVWKGFDIPVVTVDGNDAAAVYQEVAAAVAGARSGGGPAIVEGLTYRIDPHIPIVDDPTRYRSGAEETRWRERDPLPAYRAALTDGGIEVNHEALRERARRRVEDAWVVASRRPEPGAPELEARMALL